MALNIRALAILGILIAAVVMLTGAAFAKGPGDTRPGWGFGDQNHVHTGPPGQSVHP